MLLLLLGRKKIKDFRQAFQYKILSEIKIIAPYTHKAGKKIASPCVFQQKICVICPIKSNFRPSSFNLNFSSKPVI